MKIKFVCDKCGEVKVATFDGYPFGDRLLEGVKFDAVLNDEGEVSVSVRPEAEAYFADLNQKKWLAEAKRFIEGTDVVNCGVCGEECGVQPKNKRP